MADPARPRILVIRLGALGDFCLSFGPFAAIRAHHPRAHITLLTTAPYVAMARAAPWFDDVILDPRPSWWRIGALRALGQALHGYDLVYDLQTSGRSTRYFWLAGLPAWSGIGAFRRYPHTDPARDRLHTLERQRGQLREAGIKDFPRPEIGWLTGGRVPVVPRPFALLVAGAAPHRPQKRWPAGHFGDLAARLAARGVTPVVVGTAGEAAIAAEIRAVAPAAIDLVGHTDLFALAALAANAAVAIGNDTGPMHLAAAVGCRCVVLFGTASNPELTAPRGPEGSWVSVLRASQLADIAPGAVAEWALGEG